MTGGTNMAREIRIQRKTEMPEVAPPAGRREPKTTEEALLAAEESRGRISATLDEIEDRIDETREQIREKANVLRPVRSRIRENPLPMIGAAAGAGLVLGLLTGGEEHEKKRMLDKDARRDLREWRAERRERMREHLDRERREAAMHEEGPSMLGHLAGTLASAAMAGLVARMRNRVSGRGEMMGRHAEHDIGMRRRERGTMPRGGEDNGMTRRGVVESY